MEMMLRGVAAFNYSRQVKAACRPPASTPATVSPASVNIMVGHANIQNTLVYAQLIDRIRDKKVRQVFTNPRIA